MLEGWAEVELGSIAELNPDQVAAGDRVGEFRYIDLTSVSAVQGLRPDLVKRLEWSDAPSRARRRVRGDDVLISTVRPYLRGFGRVPMSLDQAVASTGFCVLRSKPKLTTPGFLWALTQSRRFVDYLVSRQTGSNYPAVRERDIGEFAFALPPISDQRRIGDLVAQIDKTLLTYDRCHSRARVMQAGLTRDLCPVGRTVSGMTPLNELARYLNGRAFKPSDFGRRGRPVIRIQHLNDPNAAFDLYEGPLDDRYAIEEGDLIFSWSGTLKVVVWGRGPAALNQHLFKVEPAPNVEKTWLTYVLRSALDQFDRMTHGTTMHHITKKSLSEIGVEVPSEIEQRRVGSVLATAERGIEKIADARNRLFSLREAVLASLLLGGHKIPARYERFLEERDHATRNV